MAHHRRNSPSLLSTPKPLLLHETQKVNSLITRTCTLLVYIYLNDVVVWFRHGEIFKTHILGCPCVMLASPDAARFVLVNEAHLFKPTYPKSKEALIGPSALFFHQGPYHLRLRKLIQASFYPESLRRHVAGVEALTVAALTSLSHGRTVNTYDEMKRVGNN